MEKENINNLADSGPQTISHLDITSNISPDDKFLIDGREYSKTLVLGGTKQSMSTSWI